MFHVFLFGVAAGAVLGWCAAVKTHERRRKVSRMIRGRS